MQIVAAVFPYLIGTALFAVVAVLFAGLFTMVRGGAFNQRWGNRLMRLRVIMQGAAVALIVIYFLITRAI
jgi:hypothetical protein